jgi:hypothetical protein
MKFKVESLRLQESIFDGKYYLGIDFSPQVSTGIPLSKKRCLELINFVKKEFPNLVIEE